MSSRPEDEESADEIEEGEIVSDEEEMLMSEGEDEDFFQEDEDEGMDIAGLMTSLLATPDGDTICSALVNLCYQLETQNKILIKMLAKMQSSKSA
ncbi:hypothetical protein OlV1_166c [Ostreococcus lucimarinus virus 1]|jgi:hypothetical protein|uniref:hypothetical protein n=1 Tax=Ostreococcus lucimarinus virus 1 TaxID=880162 RepID=UPI0001EF462A|nr:hypothetical protein OlV1_166c [Ostreococcus lucimarinus virus 1]ADQ91542.1 hypothetical protein OlV1_166c [Ostreococcus lucimarinus virus 1]AET84614.1 hypothetical protein OLOG_00153 [Ostreococcus lucimarinus virus OlV4]QBP06536.1 hypothetical protein OlV1_gene84 [Ostreococcus lucimarinus virus 1]|tara:strand:+ start:125 stop:409 length:285 start_codon:yes stop_codon:yes gene_type:complete